MDMMTRLETAIRQQARQQLEAQINEAMAPLNALLNGRHGPDVAFHGATMLDFTPENGKTRKATIADCIGAIRAAITGQIGELVESKAVDAAAARLLEQLQPAKEPTKAEVDKIKAEAKGDYMRACRHNPLGIAPGCRICMTAHGIEGGY